MSGDDTAAKPLAVHLYTLREEAEEDVGWVLERVAEIGFRGVEIYERHGLSPREFQDRLDELDLEHVSTLVLLESEADLEASVRALDDEEAVGNDTIVSCFEAEQFASLDATRRAIDRFNRYSEAVHDRGMRLGYHNHWWEFSESFDGRQVMSYLLEELDPRVFLVADLYWMQAGGCDLPATLEELGPRVKILHLKDGPATPSLEVPMTAAGAGAVDLAGAVAASPGAEWHTVELDSFDGEMLTAVEESYRYLVGNGLSSGTR